MSAIPAYSCCCGGEPWPPEYYVFTPCAATPCCDLECDGAPQVKWCPSYAASQGLIVPMVVNPSVCLLMKRDCCTYVFTNVVSNPGGVCPTGAGPWNEGTVIGTRSIGPGEFCCDYEEIEPPDNCVTQDAYPEGSPLAPSFCDAYVFEPYTNADMWGIVPSKPVTVRSTLTYCYPTFGKNWDENCDNCPRIDHAQSAITHAQQIGYCIPTDPLSECPGQRTYTQTVMLTCAECNPCGPCCGIDPCDGVDPNADWCEDPARTYSVKTCYSVSPCLDEEDEETFFEQDVLTVTYDFCATTIDPDDPNALALLTALFTGGSPVRSWDPLTAYPYDPGIALYLCPAAGLFSNPAVYVFSGDAKDIANAINSLSVNFPWLSAQADEQWGECFWFGTRQTCNRCPGDDPSLRPAYGSSGEPADELVFDRVEIVGTTSFRAIFRGRSKKYYACAAQTLSSVHSVTPGCIYSDTDVVNLAVSATGDAENGYALDCLSPAEYACGDRYSMRQIEQDYCPVEICTVKNPAQEVIGCDAVTGYPLLDVIVSGVTILKGWVSLCGGGAFGGMPYSPQIRCRSYPWLYEVTPCGDEPPAGTCSPGVYQSPAAYCETDATPITVT